MSYSHVGTKMLRVSSRGAFRPNFGRRMFLPVGFAAGGAVLVSLALSTRVHNDAAPPESSHVLVAPIETVLVRPESDEGALAAWSWGSNKYNVASTSSKSRSIRTPQPLPHLSGVALRDLALHERHGACVDAAGNVYQWGDGFFGSPPAHGDERRPKLTLKGKDISQIAITPSKLYALSKAGTIFVLSSLEARQKASQTQASSWWSMSWLWGSSSSVDYVELKPDSSLGFREKFTSISAGRDHLLALTSSGRSFGHAVTSLANSHGQLGIRKISVTYPDDTGEEITLELTPKSLQDSLAFATPFVRPTASKPEAVEDADIRWSRGLYELPSLKGVQAAQLVAGGRSSFLRTTEEGRVLAWGANEYGQLGLGASFNLTTVQVPTEVVLSRAYPGGTVAKCTDIAPGGDLVYFTVERQTKADRTAVVDVLAAGMGQWGALGNNLYNQVQGAPVKVRTVSGILQYNDMTSSLQALPPHRISVSPTGHTVATLETLSTPDPDTAQGRDVLSWGLNSSYELGNGKRTSAPVPSHVKAFTESSQRLMMRERKHDVKDLEGKTWGKKVPVQECAIAGWGCTAVYWRIL